MEREKLTVTIKSDLFPRIDSIIDGKKIRNRSHATEYLIRKGLGESKVNKALVMAGGQGTRLRPFTYELPKSLIPVQGKALMDHCLDLLLRHNIRDIIISIGYLGHKVKDYYKDGKHLGMRIQYVEEKEPLGTAGAMWLAREQLKEPFYLIWSDVLTDIDLDDFAEFFHRTEPLIAMSLSTVSDPSRFGVAKLRGHRILDFVEKPPLGTEPSKLVNAGYNIIHPDVIDLIGPGQVSFERELLPQILKKNKLFGYPFEGQWFDTGTQESYEQVLKEWKGIN